MIKRIKNKYIIYNDKNEIITISSKKDNTKWTCYNIPSIIISGNDINNLNVYNEALINSLNLGKKDKLLCTKNLYDTYVEDIKRVRVEKLLNIRNYLVYKSDFDENIKLMSFNSNDVNYIVDKINIDELIDLLGKKYIYSDINLITALEKFKKIYMKGR